MRLEPSTPLVVLRPLQMQHRDVEMPAGETGIGVEHVAQRASEQQGADEQRDGQSDLADAQREP